MLSVMAILFFSSFSFLMFGDTSKLIIQSVQEAHGNLSVVVNSAVSQSVGLNGSNYDALSPSANSAAKREMSIDVELPEDSDDEHVEEYNDELANVLADLDDDLTEELEDDPQTSTASESSQGIDASGSSEKIPSTRIYGSNGTISPRNPTNATSHSSQNYTESNASSYQTQPQSHASQKKSTGEKKIPTPNRKSKKKKRSDIPKPKVPASLVPLSQTVEWLKQIYSVEDGSKGQRIQKFDSVGIPNVVHGCGLSTTKSIQATRDVDQIQIHVIGWRREEGMRQLLDQLEASNYEGWDKEVPLYIHIDGNSSQTVDSVAQNFKWSHGPKHLDLRSENVGLREMWFSSLGKAAHLAGDNTLMVVFEDDIMVSTAYFQWLIKMIDEYARNPRCRDANLVGFSLSTITFQETFTPFHKWSAQEIIAKSYKHKDPSRPTSAAFLTSVPSSWGAAYWSDHWKDFDKFVKIRMQQPFYDLDAEKIKEKNYWERKMSPPHLHIPGARSNWWQNSWKRFMVDMMHARGLVMLYPNLLGPKALAYSKQSDGVHGGKKTDNRFFVDLAENIVWEREGKLSRYGELNVFGLNHKLQSKEMLRAVGIDFLNGISRNCTDIKCGELLSSWAPSGWNPPNPYTDAFGSELPVTCVVDAFTSTDSMHRKPASVPTGSDRFLFYEPQYGTTNQLQSIIEAYAWAKALDRRLVLPPIFTPRVSAYPNVTDQSGWIPFLDFYQLDNGKASSIFRYRFTQLFGYYDESRPISFDEFLQLGVRPWRMIRPSRTAVFDTSARLLTQVMGGSEHDEVVNLRHLFDVPISIEKVQYYLGGCDDQVLAFDGMFFPNMFYGPKKGGKQPAEKPIQNTLSLSSKVRAVVNKIHDALVRELGTADYSCYHVRQGDFVEMCHKLSSSDPKVLRYIPKWFAKTGKEYLCLVTAEDLSRELEAVNRPALLLSDNPASMQSAIDGFPKKIVTSSWVSNATKEISQMEGSELSLFSLIVDQELCAAAHTAVLNKFSTVSGRIGSLRGPENTRAWKAN